MTLWVRGSSGDPVPAQVDPITGHSTLDADQLGLPASSTELIDAAVAETGAPQPVGAFSSSVAVKPTSGVSADLSSIMGAQPCPGSSSHAVAI